MEDKREELFYNQKHISDIISAEEKKLSDSYCEKYKAFLSAAKTEREAVRETIKLAEACGFKELDRNGELKTGDKVYRSIHDKAVLLAVIGRRPLSEGAHIEAAHIDSPRLDLKQMPLYEDNEIAFLKTHYYGGIRKYQWVTIPLELHGVVVLKNGEKVEVCIGAEDNDPTFVITDLLPHLAASQSKKPLSTAIEGESLNLFTGSVPSGSEGSDRVKLAVMEMLNEKYGIKEEDFLSAELEAVPGLPVKDVGIDRSAIGAYGHDDRVCAFAELQAILDIDTPELAAVCILADKEEIGSEGVSGMQSEAFECFMEDLCDAQGVKLRHCFEKSLCISADVTCAFDPNYPSVFEKRNCAKINYGIALAKFTGRGGKSGSNDASAELVGRVRRVLDANGVVWQMGELGKVDEGGGGTVAKYMAKRNIETIDAGVPVLSMHSPFELVSKLDCYMTYKAMKAVYEEK